MQGTVDRSGGYVKGISKIEEGNSLVQVRSPLLYGATNLAENAAAPKVTAPVRVHGAIKSTFPAPSTELGPIVRQDTCHASSTDYRNRLRALSLASSGATAVWALMRLGLSHLDGSRHPRVFPPSARLASRVQKLSNSGNPKSAARVSQ